MKKTKKFDLALSTSKAVEFFWKTKNRQLKNSSESSNNRGAVVGGKQLDGFLSLLTDASVSVGVPLECIHLKDNYVPGFFRSTKDWDFMIISPSGKLLVLIELKSQVGSYGNNFNNRTEEALGNATDLWTAYREKEFQTYGCPWVGFLMLIGDDDKSNSPVRNFTKYFPVLTEFENTTYIDRYRILCEKLMTERLYTSTCLIRTKNSKSFSDETEELSIKRFINSLQGYLIGCSSEFNQ